MFDSLSEKLQGTLAGVRQRGALTEDDINKAMREIRLALLEADVNFKVVKQFTNAVKERALGIEITKQLNPGQQVIKIVNDELTSLMGGQSAGITFSPRPPTVILMAGLQGSGKTTATAKLAKLLKEQNKSSRRRRRLRRLPPGGRRAARQGRRPGGRDGLRAGDRQGPRRHRRLGARSGQARRQGRPDRRHLRPPARRRGADGGAREHQEAGQAARRDARRGRDDRPGRGQRRRAVRRGRPVRRRDPVQARRRCPRRRRAVRQGGHRQADPVRVHRREARRLREVPPGPDGAADPRHGRRPVVHREGRGPDRGGRGQGARAQAPEEPVHARGLPRPAQEDPPDGAADVAARDDPRASPATSSRR